MIRHDCCVLILARRILEVLAGIGKAGNDHHWFRKRVVHDAGLR